MTLYACLTQFHVHFERLHRVGNVTGNFICIEESELFKDIPPEWKVEKINGGDEKSDGMAPR